MNSSKTIGDIEFTTKNSWKIILEKKYAGSDCFSVEFCQTSEEKLKPVFHNFLEKIEENGMPPYTFVRLV